MKVLRGKVSVSLVGSWPKKCEECRKELTAGVHLKLHCGQMQAVCLVLPVFFLWLVPTNPLKASLEVRNQFGCGAPDSSAKRRMSG